jgi:chromosome segregation ATPase
MNAAKKKAGVDLPKIKDEMKKLQLEIDDLKKNQDVKMETKESFDKQLDGINERRKKMRDERDKLYKAKEELRDTYYGALILYSKQQYLLQDIAWMTQMQDNLKVR